MQTDASGGFSLAGLPITGTYTLTAHKENFANAESAGLSLIGGSTAEANLQLNVSGGQTKVTVTGTVGQVRTDSRSWAIS